LGEAIEGDVLVKPTTPHQPTHVTDQTRIQVRVPSGPPLKFNLASSTKLTELIDMVAKQGGLTKNKMTLQAAFPVKVFGSADLQHTLADLELCPSATLIVKLQ
jgi:UBX domain-containing protein 1/4